MEDQVELKNQDRKCLTILSEEDLIKTILETKMTFMNGLQRTLIPIEFRRAIVLTSKGMIEEQGDVTKLQFRINENL